MIKGMILKNVKPFFDGREGSVNRQVQDWDLLLLRTRFCSLLRFGRGRSAVFVVFCLSAVAEAQFSLFSVLRPWPKRCFRCFLSFARGRNAVFAVFYLSAVGETQFSLFFTFRPWPKRSFCCFLSFGRGRNVVFAVFCLSAVAETRNLSVFDFPPWRKCGN